MTSLNDGDSDGTESITDSGRGGSEEGEHFGPRLLGHHLHHPHHHLRSPNTATASSPETLSKFLCEVKVMTTKTAICANYYCYDTLQ